MDRNERIRRDLNRVHGFDWSEGGRIFELTTLRPLRGALVLKIYKTYDGDLPERWLVIRQVLTNGSVFWIHALFDAERELNEYLKRQG